VLLQPEKRAGDDDLPASLTDYSEATLPGHLRGDEEGTEGYKAGDVLPGDGPINDALAELKQPGSVLARQKADAAKKPAPKPAAAAVKPADTKPADTKPADSKPAEQPAAAPATPAPAKPDAPASTVPIKP